MTTAYGTLCAGTTATGPVQTVSPGTTAYPLVSAGSSTLPSYALLTVPGGGTGLATATTAYSPICAGTTATGAFQAASTGLSTSGYILTSNGSSAIPSFKAASASSSGLILIASASPSNVASVQFNNDLTSSYNHYLLVYCGFAASASILSVQYGYGSTPTYSSSGYTGQIFYGITGSTVVASTTAASYIATTVTIGSSSLYGFNGSLTLGNVNVSGSYKDACGVANCLSNTGTALTPVISGANWEYTSGVATSVQVFFTTANITGDIRLYGYN